MIDIVIFLVLLACGFFFGRYNEARHFRSIRTREAELGNIFLFSERLPPPQPAPVDCRLVAGSCVVSVDYFKSFVAGLRNLFGGRVSSYETLLDRARREALLRMKAEAAACGSALVVNVKIETTSIGGENPNAPGAVEVMAYGTALVPKRG